jgi:O-antigen/teichoic acid export membrane protein
MIVPLITYPYLIRVLGKETYGLVIFAQALVGYLQIMVGFGFNISATKEVSIHKDNKEKLSEIVSSVIIIKIALFVIGLIILSLSLIFIEQANNYKALFYLSLWVCLDEVLSPFWYFQGIQRMKYITYITLISRLFFLTLIFIFIQTPNDYLYVPVINGISAIISGVIALYIIFKKHKIKFIIQPYNILKIYFKESIPIFISNVSIALYVKTNKVVLGTFFGMSEVAYYDLGEKIISLLKIPQGLITQTIFPKINKDKDINFVKKLFQYSIILNILLFILVLIFSKYIVLLLGGQQMTPAIWVINILALSVPIIALSNIFGFQVLIPFGYSKQFSRVIIYSGFIYLIQLSILWRIFGITIYSVSVITVTTEIFVLGYMLYYCKKYRLW